MNIYFAVTLQSVYFMLGLALLAGALKLFFLYKPDITQHDATKGLALGFGLSALLLTLASFEMKEPSFVAALYVANFALVLAMIVGMELCRRLIGLSAKTAMCVGLATLAAGSFALFFNPSKPMLGHAIRHVFEAILGCGLAWSVIKSDQQGNKFLVRSLSLSAFVFGLVGLIAYGISREDGFGFDYRASDLLMDGARVFVIATALLSSVLIVTFTAMILHAQKAKLLMNLLSTDELTKVGSRRSLESQGRMFAERRNSRGQLTAVLLLDIDHFKKINDRYGHQAGDQVLKECATALRRSLRPEAFLARYGGEEFCAIVPVEKMEDATVVAERLRHSVCDQAIVVDGSDVNCTISIGMAMMTGNDNLDVAISKADQALYQAKREGRNCVRSYRAAVAPLNEKAAGQNVIRFPETLVKSA